MSDLTPEKIKALELMANDVRKSFMESLAIANSGHSAGPLGMADIFTALYFHILKHDPENPEWEERDKVVLSNGHICPVLYSAMAHAGYFPVSELKTLRKLGSRLQGHPHREFLPMLETSSGPLGCGLSQSVGMALADRIDHGKNPPRHIYCLMSDGELEEGNIWEGAMLAGKERLHNIIGFIDRNNIQIDGDTEDIMPLEPLVDKWKSFGWHVIEIDGHNMEEIVDAVNQGKAVYEKPTVIIAHTIPGKGVSFMERDYRWHGAPPGKGPDDRVEKDKQLEVALSDLRNREKEIRES